MNRQGGEVDVLADFTGSRQELHRLTGNLVPIENKWKANATPLREIHIQHRKAETADLQSSCLVSCFVSMAGFTADANDEIDRCQSPFMIRMDEEKVTRLINSNSTGREFQAQILAQLNNRL